MKDEIKESHIALCLFLKIITYFGQRDPFSRSDKSLWTLAENSYTADILNRVLRQIVRNKKWSRVTGAINWESGLMAILSDVDTSTVISHAKRKPFIIATIGQRIGAVFRNLVNTKTLLKH